MVQPYNIGLTVGADIDPLKRDMNEASKTVEGFGSRAGTALTSLAKGFAVVGTAVVAAGAGMMAIAKEASQAAREMDNLARASGTAFETFQELAYGAKTVGVENQKFADILKDVNERVGEFAASGSGPMKDFFENVAPLVDVTIDQFQKLSGPEALQLYYDSLKKANVSQKEMTFYLEQMASDTSRLVPLLEQGGKGFEEMARQAREVNAVISDMDMQVLQENSVLFQDMEAAVKGVGNSLAVALNPEIQATRDLLVAASDQTSAFIRGLREMRAESEKQAKIEESVSEILRNQKFAAEGVATLQEESGRTVNELLQRQVELRDAIVRKERELFQAVTQGNDARIPGLQKSLELMLQSQAENDKIIQSLRTESEEAQKIYELRTGITEAVKEQAAAQAEMAEAGTAVNRSNPGDQFGTFAEDPFAASDPNKRDSPFLTQEDEFEVPQEEVFATERDLYTAHWEEMNRIAVEGAGGVAKIVAQQFGNAAGSTAAAGKSMFESFSQSSRKMFEVNKAWGIADAIISTAQGIAAGVKLGWPMGIPAVAWAVANGAAQISKIRLTQFGGGGGAPTATTAAPTTGQTMPLTPGQSDGGAQRVLRIEGLNPNSLYTGSQLENLAGSLEEFWNDGGGKGRVIFAGERR